MEVALRYIDSTMRSSKFANADVVVINGVISFPIAVLAYFCLPDHPARMKPNWLFTERVSAISMYLDGRYMTLTDPALQ